MSENFINWTYDQDATSKDPGDFSAGVPQLSFDVVAPSNLKLGGTVTQPRAGTVRSISFRDGTESITADSPLGLFNAWHTIPPSQGLLSDKLTELRDMVGGTFGISSLPITVTFPGFEGVVWDYIKEVLSANRVESLGIAPDSNLWELRTYPFSTVELSLDEATSISTELNAQQSAPKVQINYYPSTYGTQLEFYPGENDTPISADSGETVEVEVEIPGTVSSVNQPQAYYVLPHKGPYDGTDGAFVVTDNEGIPLQPDEFYGLGGNLQVETTSNPSVILVTFTAPRDQSRGPFSLLESDDYDRYNSLHITGTGLRQTEEHIILHTGASESITGEDVGTTVENRHIQTLAQAYTVGQYTAAAWSGLTASCAVGGFPYTAVSPGARFRYGGVNYRVNSVSQSPEGSSMNGLLDTSISDLSAAWTGKTMGDITYGTMYDTTLEGLKV